MFLSLLAITRRGSQCYEEILIHISLWFSTLKVEATRSYETSDDSQVATWQYIPEDRTLINLLHSMGVIPSLLLLIWLKMFFLMYFYWYRFITLEVVCVNIIQGSSRRSRHASDLKSHKKLNQLTCNFLRIDNTQNCSLLPYSNHCDGNRCLPISYQVCCA
jgi:hypothetical protein